MQRSATARRRRREVAGLGLGGGGGGGGDLGRLWLGVCGRRRRRLGRGVAAVEDR